MEGGKTAVMLSGGVDLVDGNGIEGKFVEFCKSGLSLDQETCNEALELLRQTKHLLLSNTSSIGSGTPDEAERFWFAFVLYSVKRLKERNETEDSQGMGESDFNLCQIMRQAKLNIVEFFKELPQFVMKVGPTLLKLYGVNWEKRLEVKELQANFVHLSLLSRYYKRAYREFFLPINENASKNFESTISSDYVSDYHRFGWLLFLALRVHAFSRFKDMVTCTNGLVSILAILIIHVPVRFRNFSSIDSHRFVKRGNKGVDLVASLCNMYDTSEDELKKTLEQTNNLIVEILKRKPCTTSECKSETLVMFDTDGLLYFEGLMEEPLFSSSMNILEKDYNDSIRSKGELDERVFINEEDSLLRSGSSSGGSMNLNGVKRKFDSLSSPSKTITSPPSPRRADTLQSNGNTGNVTPKVVATPVSTAMTTAKWLRTVVSPLSSKPSPKLESFFKSCDKDVTVDVMRRARVIMEAIFPSSTLAHRSVNGNLQPTNLMDNIWAEQRRLESVKLYFRVLEVMCSAECQLIKGNNLTSLLSNERFHRCMLACSAELVLATHKTVTMLFPAVLERTGITAFDLSKVIESFIRHEESLPRELRRHLNSLEERLLESMVWEKGSSLYNSLIVARPSLLSEVNSLGLMAEPMPSLDAIALQNSASNGSLTHFPPALKQETPSGQNSDMRSPKRVCTDYRSVLVERNSFTSPMKDRLLTINNKSKLPPPLQSAFATPTRPLPGGGGETCAETGISMCFNKITKLAAVRINSMVERLQLSQQIRESVFCLFQKILGQRTSLFFNRHIDQIILCCFYGVAKITQLKLTFKEIIFYYRKQPQCKPQVFRSIYVDRSAERHTGKSGQDHVDVITFYNEVFILSVKPLLLELVPAGTSLRGDQASEANNVQCSGTPKTSSFPSIPDMSPKKVSTSHNVYVSPLRSSKMDALISHSSKSYYACVGESTHAFQSPSKDLSAINNRLNGSLKRRGTLNFDEVDGAVVSDAFIASNLYTIPNSPSQKLKKEV